MKGWIKELESELDFNSSLKSYECQFCGEIFDIHNDIEDTDSVYFSEDFGCYLPICPRCGIKGDLG